MELSTYFRINTSETGQFERTLIVAEDDSYVSYLEGCTAPAFDTNQVGDGGRGCWSYCFAPCSWHAACV